MLQNCLVRETDEDDDGIKDIVELVLKKLDEDRDGRVNEQDWNTAVAKDSLLLEAFGQCLPEQRDIEEFLELGDNSKAALNEMLGLKKTSNSTSNLTGPSSGSPNAAKRNTTPGKQK